MRNRKDLIYSLIAVLVLAAATVAALASDDPALDTPSLVMVDIFFLYVIAISALSSELRRSMSETIYSYKNILLIGGILFLSVLAAAQIGTFFRYTQFGELSLHRMYSDFLQFPKRFSQYALLVIELLSLLVGISNIALIRHEGFCLHNALSIVVAGFYISGAVAIYFISSILAGSTDLPQAILVLRTVIPLFFGMMLCYLECVLFGTAFMGWKAAKTKPALDKDYIIILGCSIDKRGGLLPLLKGRVNRAIRFAWEQEIATGKPMKYVPSGGQGPNEIMSEGSAMELYLKSRGAEDDEVFPEKKSVNTWENMCFSKKIIDELKPYAKVAFATTNYHILRSGILARQAGLDAEGIAGDTKWYFWPNGFVREFFGILAMNVRAHVRVGILTALGCTIVGFIEYFFV